MSISSRQWLQSKAIKGAWKLDISSQVIRMYMRLYLCELFYQFLRYRLEILLTLTKSCSFSESPITDHCIWYKMIKIKFLCEKPFYLAKYLNEIWHRLISKAMLQYSKKLYLTIDRTTIAYSCHRNRSIRIKYLYEKLFHLTRYFHEIWHRLLP